MTVFKKDVLPSSDDYEFYARNGWILTDLIVKDEILDACREAIEEVYTGQYDHVFEWSSKKENSSFGKVYLNREAPRMDFYLSHHKDTIREVLHSPILAEYAAQLINAQQVRYYRDILLSKPPNTESKTGTGWHTDKNYWQTCSSNDLTTAWFPLEDCGEEDGCLTFISGSHLWDSKFFLKKVDLDDLERIGRYYQKDVDEINRAAVPHKAGQISFHDCNVLHGALPNHGSKVRKSLVMVYQDKDNHHVPLKKRLALNFNTNDRIGPSGPDGLPNYADSEFYPLLYQNTSTKIKSEA